MVTTCLLVHSSCFADSVTDVISNDVVFYTGTLSPFPSKKAVIDYSINLQNTTPDNVVSLKIYTIDDHAEFSRMCLNEKYGQLKNEKLYIPLTASSSQRGVNCELTVDDPSGIIHCTGSIAVQDYIARLYSFSLSYDCDDLEDTRSTSGSRSKSGSKSRLHSRTLKGTSFNITIHDETNDTLCSPLPQIPGFDCSEFYPEVTYPSLMGDSRLEEGVESLKLLYSRFQQILFSHKLDPAISNCYKYMFEASCYFYLPRCQDNNMLVPCREMCEDLFNGCGWVSEEVRDLFDCKYLPPKSGSVPCFYKHVTCEEPEVPERALVVDGMNDTFTAPSSHVTFRCEDGFLLEGPATVRCLYGGRWSEGTAVCGGGRPTGADCSTRCRRHYRRWDIHRHLCLYEEKKEELCTEKPRQAF